MRDRGQPLDGWGWDEASARPAIRRAKQLMLPSSWVLLDRDVSNELPEELRSTDEDAWRAKLGTVFPGLADVRMVDLPSSTGRIVWDADGSKVFGRAGGSHTTSFR